ncbi:lysozyme C-like [Anomaloglossus baeobatrachus]|uniref:lysozyme C-like n=1 Tax=Anomaloglossus baeobatrachus TaxID=238106 RepID=UPI003F504177
MKIIIVLILAALTVPSWTLDNCEQWLKTLKQYSSDDLTTSKLMCIAHHATQFNPLPKGDKEHYGVFQISARKYCKDCNLKTEDRCNMDCNKLLDGNLDDDAKCVFKIFKDEGIKAWKGWEKYCASEDISRYLRCDLKNDTKCPL